MCVVQDAKAKALQLSRELAHARAAKDAGNAGAHAGADAQGPLAAPAGAHSDLIKRLMEEVHSWPCTCVNAWNSVAPALKQRGLLWPAPAAGRALTDAR